MFMRQQKQITLYSSVFHKHSKHKDIKKLSLFRLKFYIMYNCSEGACCLHLHGRSDDHQVKWASLFYGLLHLFHSSFLLA